MLVEVVAVARRRRCSQALTRWPVSTQYTLAAQTAARAHVCVVIVDVDARRRRRAQRVSFFISSLPFDSFDRRYVVKPMSLVRKV